MILIQTVLNDWVIATKMIIRIHGERVTETEDVADSDSYGDYYDDSVATCKFPDYDWVSFFRR